MNFRPLSGFRDVPLDAKPLDPHLGLDLDYEFAGKRVGEQVTLLIHSWIIDSMGNIFSRKCSYLVPRIEAQECFLYHMKSHLMFLGVDDMSCRRLMRDFVIDNKKAVAFNELDFQRTVR